MKIKISPELRKLYADKILDLTNIGVGATLFGQFLSDKAFSWIVTTFGMILLFIGYTASYIFYPRIKEVKR